MPKKKKDEQVEAEVGGTAVEAEQIDKPAKAVKKAAKKATAAPAVSLSDAVETAASDADVVDVAATIVDDVESSDLAADASDARSGDSADDDTVVSLMTDVVFRLQAHDDVREIVLVGDFNGWSQAAHPMTRNGDSFEITVPLQRDRRYRYRYLVDGHRWENDWNADEYTPNEYGGDDSVRIV